MPPIVYRRLAVAEELSGFFRLLCKVAAEDSDEARWEVFQRIAVL